MEFRRALDAVLRTPYTTPSASTCLALRRTAFATGRRQHPTSLLPSRSVSTSIPQQAAATAPKPRQDEAEEPTTRPSSSTSGSSRTQSTATGQARIDQLLTQLSNESNRGSAIRRPNFKSAPTSSSASPASTAGGGAAQAQAQTQAQAQAQPKPTAPTTTPLKKPAAGTSSLQDFLEQLGLSSTPSSGPGSNLRPGARRGVQVDRMSVPGSAYRDPSGTLIVPSLMATQFATLEGPDMSAPSFKLGPSLGRSVTVSAQKSMDLARAFRSLEIKCAVNNVKRDFNTSRFHERPGMKRKRLKQVRWRARFKAGFQAIVRRVEDMRRKGW